MDIDVQKQKRYDHNFHISCYNSHNSHGKNLTKTKCALGYNLAKRGLEGEIHRTTVIFCTEKEDVT
jgi:hypothetical protein